MNCSNGPTAKRAARPRPSISRSSMRFGRGLAVAHGLSKEEGSAIIARYFERFRASAPTVDDTLRFVRETGYTQTLFGRKTHFYPTPLANPSIRGRCASARDQTRPTRASADLIKRAMARMDDALAEAGFDGVRMLLQSIERVFEVPDGREESGRGGSPGDGNGGRTGPPQLDCSARCRSGLGRALGRRALSPSPS